VSRIGILGGSFDPPHLGHLILAEVARDDLDLDRILFVPAGDPPHKQHEAKTPVTQRLTMLERALNGHPGFSISRVDIDRPGPHYTVDMLRLLAQQFPGAELVFLMGGDSFGDLLKWHQPAQVVAQCQLAVMRRPGDDIDIHMHDAALPGLSGRVVLLDTPLIEISSTLIMERVRLGRSVRYLVPEAVRAYINDYQLYRDEPL
jgi:nicotinate-nucleotide adenylyltransferase